MNETMTSMDEDSSMLCASFSSSNEVVNAEHFKPLRAECALTETPLSTWNGTDEARNAYLEFYNAETKLADVIAKNKNIFAADFKNCGLCHGEERRRCKRCQSKALEIKDLWVSAMSPYEQLLWTSNISDLPIKENETLEEGRKYHMKQRKKLSKKLSYLLGRVINLAQSDNAGTIFHPNNKSDMK